MHVCCGSRWGQCVLFINTLGSLTAPCLMYNTAMYTDGRCMVHELAGAAGGWFIRTPCALHYRRVLHVSSYGCTC